MQITLNLYILEKPMKLSDEVLRKIGLTKLNEGESISGVFYRIIFFSITGVNLDDSSLVEVSENIQGHQIRAVVHNNINVAFRALLSDDYTDEADDLVKKGWNPPFLLVQIGSNQTYISNDIFYKQEGERYIDTYAAFPKAREDLDIIEKVVVPRLVSAFSVSLRSFRNLPEVKRLTSCQVGLTQDGRIIRDISFVASIRASVSSRIEVSDLEDKLNEAIIFSNTINGNASDFYDMAIHEADSLKAFLFYFLAIEMKIGGSFDRRRYRNILENEQITCQRKRDLRSLLVGEEDRIRRAIFLRFVWCSCYVWDEIYVEDAEEFKRVKRIRDDIAHGNRTTPPTGADIESAKKIARIILANAR